MYLHSVIILRKSKASTRNPLALVKLTHTKFFLPRESGDHLKIAYATDKYGKRWGVGVGGHGHYNFLSLCFPHGIHKRR